MESPNVPLPEEFAFEPVVRVDLGALLGRVAPAVLDMVAVRSDDKFWKGFAYFERGTYTQKRAKVLFDGALWHLTYPNGVGLVGTSVTDLQRIHRQMPMEYRHASEG